MKSIWRSSVIIILSFFLNGCLNSKKLNEFDLADGYQVNGLQYEMDASFQSLSDSISELVINISPNDFLFVKTNTNKHRARYSIGYKVFEGYNENEPIDTATIHYSLKQENKTDNKLHRIKMIAPLGENYQVKVFINDENRNFVYSQFYTLRKETTGSRSFFEVKSINSPSNFSCYQSDSFNVHHLKKKESTVKVMLLQLKTTCAPKPHEVNYRFKFAGIPDTSWFQTINASTKFPPVKGKYYHFITDTSTMEGFSVFNMGKDFPKISSIKQANGALGYLVGNGKYAEILREKNQKKVFENEWLKLAGNRTRARNLIREFYKEASITNQLFTSNQPGWSTDRGMVYIIFGPPKIVYRYNKSEVWIYGEENNLLSEQFEFRKIDSDFSDNIFELRRNINYKINFNRMVNAWIDERGY